VAPVKRALVYLWCYQRKRHHQKRPRTNSTSPCTEWIIEPGLGGTDVRIVHDFTPPWPAIVGPLFARYIVGDFIHNIASKTLRTIKGLAEADQQQLNVV